VSAARVRQAVADDIGRLAALRRAWVEEASGPIDDGGEFEREFARWADAEGELRTAWIAFVGDAAVGMLNMAEFRRMPQPGTPSGRWGYIGNVFVLAAHRNRQIGGQLLDAAMAEARTRRYARLVLSPSPRSVPFYRRAGFAAADSLLVLPLG
jgi:GNAT superfamily N-acetyltransferase